MTVASRAAPHPLFRLPHAALAATLLALAVLALGPAASLPATAQTDELAEANQLFRQGQLDRALDRVDAVLKGKPKDARARFLRGIILTEQNKPNDAIAVFTALTQDYPELPEPYNNLAVLYASQGQYEKARQALDLAIRTHPSYATAHENLGDIYAKMASQAYDKALQLDRNNQGAQTKLNLIRDLFSPGAKPPKTAATRPDPLKVAAAPAPKPEPAKVAATPAPKPAEPAPAAKPTPAATAAPAKPETASAKPVAAATDSDAVVRAITNWARAWSANDVAGYLGHYAADFKAPDGKTREKWEAERTARIAKPKKIQVSVDAPKVTFNDKNRATVTFRQHYRSDTLKTSSTKTLIMVKAGENWLIQQERVGG